ncbi:MAG: hypothetical protein U0V87_10385 [Acidobacteriota bacterium]
MAVRGLIADLRAEYAAAEQAKLKLPSDKPIDPRTIPDKGK